MKYNIGNRNSSIIITKIFMMTLYVVFSLYILEIILWFYLVSLYVLGLLHVN